MDKTESVSVSVDAPSKADQNESAEHSLFGFEKIPPKSLFAHQSTRKNQDLFDKWNLTPGLAVPKYRVVERRKNEDDRVDETTRRANMVRGLFSDAKVRSDLGLRPDERSSSSSSRDVEVARLSCDAVTMDFFDPLVEHGERTRIIVSASHRFLVSRLVRHTSSARRRLNNDRANNPFRRTRVAIFRQTFCPKAVTFEDAWTRSSTA